MPPRVGRFPGIKDLVDEWIPGGYGNRKKPQKGVLELLDEQGHVKCFPCWSSVMFNVFPLLVRQNEFF